jgi:hypothetical protein
MYMYISIYNGTYYLWVHAMKEKFLIPLEFGSISSSTTLSSTGLYLSGCPGSMAASQCIPQKPIWE